MGTLTAHTPYLDSYCVHKLPTSCRLTSIPNCCACADERAHAASYSTYIDGVGFVPRGTRWQRYCWFCKEFWEERVRVSGLRATQTRVPEVPDQTAWLGEWYDCYRGYQTVKSVDDEGVEKEERVPLELGEDLSDATPGCLPRTVDEVREGRDRARRDEEEAAAAMRQARAVEAEQAQHTGPSLDDTLEGMFQAASLEESQAGGARQAAEQQTATAEMSSDASRRSENNVHAQAMVPAGSRNREYQARRVVALRRELHRMRNGIERVISGLRDLGENVPDHSQATNNLTALGRTLDTINGAPTQREAERAIISVNQLTNNTATSQSDRTLAGLQARVDAARAQVNDARNARDQAAAEFDLAEQEFQSSQSRFSQVQREHRTAENYMRIFGTREEMLAQGENYESPIGGMFRRADERFRAAEDVRREERTLRQVLEDEARAGGEQEARMLAELEGRSRDVWGVPTETSEMQYHYPPRYPPGTHPEADGRLLEAPQGEESELEEYYRMMRRQEGAQLEPSTNGHEHRASDENFPRSMLNALMEAREGTAGAGLREQTRHVQSGAATDRSSSDNTPDARPQSATAPSRTTGPRPFSDVECREWCRQNAEFVIKALLNNSQLRQANRMREEGLRALLRNLQDIPIHLSFPLGVDLLTDDATFVWQIGLPAEWLARRKAAVDSPTHQRLRVEVSPGVGFPYVDFADYHNGFLLTEIVAQAFQISAEVRRRVIELNPPERLHMLYRLQAGHREDRDVAVLERLQQDADSNAFALQTWNNSISGEGAETDFVRRYDDLRRRRAREGDHSRQELNASRQATSAFALAAGRQAMETGPHTLLERMAEQDAETRAAYQRLQANGFTSTSSTTGRTRPTLYRQLTLDDYGASTISPPSSSSSRDQAENEDEQGLDARDTGRPEPQTDEAMTMMMDCKICYTQVAEVACLPCGHLVMCRWCSEQHSPCFAQDRTRPRRAAGCPVCRKGLRQKVRVFRV